MTRLAYADESRTHGNTKCYGIGAISLEADRLEGFERVFNDLKIKHNVTRELKWEGIQNRFSDINILLDWVDCILRSRTAHLSVIVVNTAQYQKWSTPGSSREDAFYVTYTQLLQHVAGRTNAPTKVFIDDRSDSYALQHEAMEIIGNRMLAQLEAKGQLHRRVNGRLVEVSRVSSKSTPGVQVADLLTGVVVAGHALQIDPGARMHQNKILAIERTAQMLGWDRLCYDTFPRSKKLNIWHFPPEYRRTPATKEVVPAGTVPYIKRTDLR